MKRYRKITAVLGVAVAGTILLGAASCSTDEPTTRGDQAQKSESKFADRKPPQVTGDAEYNNYINAQEKVYDDPANIIWCTGSFNSANSPIFTVPIAGKLTSSSVSYYPNQHFASYDAGEYYGQTLVESQSVDGMYHGTPAPYRYGFTPGGQYVEFAGNMPVLCTTALTKFQQQTLAVSAVVDTVTKKAEAQLKAGDKVGAQKTVDSAAK
jgi:hypothetical protein